MLGVANKGSARIVLKVSQGRGGHASFGDHDSVIVRLGAAAATLNPKLFPPKMNSIVQNMFESYVPYAPFGIKKLVTYKVNKVEQTGNYPN